MKTTKVFKSGNSQAVRIPKELQIHGEEVEIFKRNGDIIIREIPEDLSKAFKILTQFSEDFFSEGREDEPPQDRDLF